MFFFDNNLLSEAPKLISSEEEAAHFDLATYASENLQPHSKGTLRKKVVWGKNLLKYSKVNDTFNDIRQIQLKIFFRNHQFPLHFITWIQKILKLPY